MNRKQRREVENMKDKEAYREQMKAKSLPTHELLLDQALNWLYASVSFFAAMNFSTADIASRVAAYLKLVKEANEYIDGLSKEGLPESEFSAKMDAVGQEIALERLKSDLEDPAVIKAIEFLQTPEGLRISQTLGF